MKLYAILAVAIAISCVYLGIFGMKGKSRRTTRWLFFLMSCSMAWFLFAAGMSVNSGDRQSVALWFRLSSLGFAPFYAFNFHFYLRLLRRGKQDPREFLIYLPVPFVLVSTLLTNSLFSDFVRVKGSWHFIPAYDSPWFWVYFVYYFSYTALTTYLLFKRASRSGLRLEKRQAVLISIFTMVTLIFGSAADFLLPGKLGFPLPPLGPLFVSAYILGLWFVVMRYGFFEPSPAFVAEEIIDNIHEMILFLDSAFRVTQSNSWARRTLGLADDAAEPPPAFPELTAAPEEIRSMLQELKKSKTGSALCRIEYRTAEKTILTDSYCTRISNTLKDVAGYLVISRQNRGLEDFIARYAISRRETQVFLNLLHGKSNIEMSSLLGISERTVETHLAHIYNKTGTNSKIELFNLASSFGLSVDFYGKN